MIQEKYFSIQNEQRLVAPYIEKWGRAPSIAVMDSVCKIFHMPEVDGIIGYRDEAGCILVFGDPLCNPQDLPRLVESFHKYFIEQKKTITYLFASENFKQWACAQGYIKTALSMGDEIVVDPRVDPLLLRGKHASALRNIYSLLKKTDLHFHEYCGQNNHLEHSMEKLGHDWLEDRKGPQTSLMNVDIFSHRSNKRFFYVQEKDRIIGAIVLNRLDFFHGWTINALFYASDAPKYTSEYIILHTLSVLRQEKCPYFSFGTLPASDLRTIEGLGKTTTFLAPHVFNMSKRLFHLNSRKQFWKKFAPIIKPSYLLLHKKGIGIRDVWGILRAFNVKI
jgi:lysylphosphatidylglycerol synthetase-like protein (DUF2156 family)